MQAILVKRLPATNTRGTRWKATASSGSVTIADNYDDMHGTKSARSAAEALVEKLGWTSAAYGQLVGGVLPNGDHVFVFSESSKFERNAPRTRSRVGARVVRANPRAVILRKNPPASRVSVTLSKRAVSLAYLHAESSKAYRSKKGQPYIHKFRPGVTIQLLTDGSVRLVRPDGKPLWKDHKE